MNEVRPRLLHLHSGFNLGGKEARAVRLMNFWGDRLHHSIVSADHSAMGARAAIEPHVPCDFPMASAPSLRGMPGLARYARLARYMQHFDLVLTYNWGAMDAVMARRLYSPFMRIPPIIHHEDGFNEDETVRLKSKRNLFRSVALGAAHSLVVPSELLHRIARDAWKRPDRQIVRIPNGIDVSRYAGPPSPDAIPGFVRDPGKIVVGTVAGLRAVKNLPRLVRAVAPLGDGIQLVIVGEGSERAVVAREAQALGFKHLYLPGFLADPWRFIGLFDIFALSSDSEQFPIAVIEAMAAGLPVISTDVGDIRSMVADENAPYITPLDDLTEMTAAFARLISDPAKCRLIGAANREKAVREYGEAAMVDRYTSLYGEAMGRSLI